jgi:four helix bundle protein
LEETAYWLELIVKAAITSKAKLSSLRKECDELISIFVTIQKSAKK